MLLLRVILQHHFRGELLVADLANDFFNVSLVEMDLQVGQTDEFRIAQLTFEPLGVLLML